MVKWTPDRDVQLLIGVLKHANVAVNNKLLQSLADDIGDGCTPKAVTHRLANLKARAKNAGSGPSTPNSSKTTTPKTSTSTGKRGRPSGSASKKKKGASDDDDDDDVEMSPSANASARKAGRNATNGWGQKTNGGVDKYGLDNSFLGADEYDDEEIGSYSKRVKTEPLEDVTYANRDPYEDEEDGIDSEYV